MRVAPSIELDQAAKAALEKWANGRKTAVRLAERARIVLMAGEGKQDLEIATALGITPKKASRWRGRYLELGLKGLEKDAPRPGRTPAIDREMVAEVIRMTIEEKPAQATHWSTRSLAAVLGISDSSVLRIWRAHGLKPHRIESFKLSKDPAFSEKLEAIVGLYLSPPEHAIVLSVDEKSQVQALDRTQPGLPMKPGRAGTMTHDYKRHGTTTLFAAMEVASGKVISLCQQRHRHQEWINFLRLIDETTPEGKDLHLICDNYATHKHAKVKRWLKRHPRFHIHFTPTSSSWLNMVERFFRDITVNRLRRGVFRSIVELIEALDAYVDEHNENPKPFIWTAKASDILAKVVRAQAVLKGRSA
ncbi:MAG: IS630 family transposase [Alkalinema sp. CACIAM 70d]|nr:MAG: IS630 family transposase [Alkalinema sp. CACIAM 70d]